MSNRGKSKTKNSVQQTSTIHTSNEGERPQVSPVIPPVTQLLPLGSSPSLSGSSASAFSSLLKDPEYGRQLLESIKPPVQPFRLSEHLAQSVSPSDARRTLAFEGGGPLLAHIFRNHTFGDTARTNVDIQIEESRKKVRELESQVQDLQARSTEADELTAKHDELRVQYAELQRKQELRHLLDRVPEDARQTLLNSHGFRSIFESDTLFNAFIMSIDIRRSTELMLKAYTPDDFAGFISKLCADLRSVIFQNYGVFDKFTGDGILAFFPEFVSGPDAGYRVIAAAQRCHDVFRKHYCMNRHCFTSVLLDVGLGIGIDFGMVKFVRIGDEPTVVGTPVVYACRLGGAPAGTTLLNQPARDQVFTKYSAFCTINEAEIELKHEGRVLAYSVALNGKTPELSQPDWIEVSRTPKKKSQRRTGSSGNRRGT